MIKVKKLKNVWCELGKRTYLPFIISSTCPCCGGVVEKDLSENDYLSYPVVNQTTEINFVCFECPGETSVTYTTRDLEEDTYQKDHSWTEDVLIKVKISSPKKK